MLSSYVVRDGINQQIGGCLKDFRNKPFPVRAKIEYYKKALTVSELNMIFHYISLFLIGMLCSFISKFELCKIQILFELCFDFDCMPIAYNILYNMTFMLWCSILQPGRILLLLIACFITFDVRRALQQKQKRQCIIVWVADLYYVKIVDKF